VKSSEGLLLGVLLNDRLFWNRRRDHIKMDIMISNYAVKYWRANSVAASVRGQKATWRRYGYGRRPAKTDIRQMS